MRWQAVAQRWLRRVRGWWPDRNPLRRRCDRAEAAIVTVLVAVFLAGAPLMALAAGRQAHDRGQPEHGQLAGWHQVPAVLRTATIQRFAPSPATAWARWAAPGGVPHTGKVLAPAGLTAGAVVPVWVDAAGLARAARRPGAGGGPGGRALAGRTAVGRGAGRPPRRGPAPPGGVGRRMAGHRAGLGRSPMTRPRTGRTAAPQAPRPARPGAQAHRPGRPVTVDTGTGIATGDDGPPGS